MKIRDFCNNIAFYINQLNIRHPSFGFQKIEANHAMSRLYFTLNDLFDLHSDDEIEDVNFQPLLDLLAERWELIRHFDFSYQFTTVSAVNAAYIYVAEQLAFCLKKRRNEILMPTIQYIHNEVTDTSLNDNDLYLHQFVVSDDGKRFIEVLPCLEAAQESGILRHTSLDNGKPLILSPTECERVISHSSFTETYYTAITSLVSYRESSPSFGAALSRLAYSLSGVKYGGKNGNDNNAGNLANEGIAEFKQWFGLLKPSERKKISDAQDNLHYPFEDTWNQLSRKGVQFDKNGSEISGDKVTCIELMSNNIKNILFCNQWLFDSYPANINISEQISYSYLLQQCEVAARNIKHSINAPDYQTINRTNQMQSNDVNAYFPNIIKTANALKEVLVALPSDKRIQLIDNLKGRLTTLIPKDQKYDIKDLLPLSSQPHFLRLYNTEKNKGQKTKLSPVLFWEREVKRQRVDEESLNFTPTRF